MQVAWQGLLARCGWTHARNWSLCRHSYQPPPPHPLLSLSCLEPTLPVQYPAAAAATRRVDPKWPCLECSWILELLGPFASRSPRSPSFMQVRSDCWGKAALVAQRRASGQEKRGAEGLSYNGILPGQRLRYFDLDFLCAPGRWMSPML